MKRDIRWMQRFSNFKKALSQLQKFIENAEPLNEMEEQGLIKSFEYTYELGWNTLKDFYEEQGETNLQGSRDVLQLAFKRGMIGDGEGWMQMFKDRNQTSHTYNEETANQVAAAITSKYYQLFTSLNDKLEKEVAKA